MPKNRALEDSQITMMSVSRVMTVWASCRMGLRLMRASLCHRRYLSGECCYDEGNVGSTDKKVLCVVARGR